MSHMNWHSARPWLWIGLLVVLAAGVRLYRLGCQSFWIDEVFHIHVASQPVTEILRNYTPHAAWPTRDQAPLSFVILHPFLSAEHAEWSARLPSAVFGVCDVVAVFLVAALLLPRPIPLLAALLLVCSPLHVWYSQEVRWYAQWGCLTTLSYGALLHAWRSGRRLAWVSYALLTLLAVYTCIFSLFVIGCQALTAWWLARLEGGARRFLIHFGAVQLGVMAAAVPVFLVISSRLDAATGTPRPTTLAALAYTGYAYAAGFSLGPPLAYLHTRPGAAQLIADYPVVPLVCVVFLPLLGLGIRNLLRRPMAAAVLIPWLCGPPLAVFALALSSNVMYQVRYSIVALPAFLITIAAGITSLRSGWLRAAAVMATAACTVAALANYYWNPTYAKEDVRGALAHVRAAGIGGAAVMPVGQIALAVTYYGRGLEVLPAGDCVPGGRGSLTGSRLPHALWVIVGRDWDAEGRQCLERLSRSYATVAQQRFSGVDLWLLQQRDEVGANRGALGTPVSGCSAHQNVVRASATPQQTTRFGSAVGHGGEVQSNRREEVEVCRLSESVVW